MNAPVKTRISVQTEPFDIAAETARLIDGLADVGAIVTFVGVCRSENGRLAALELEHYPGMAEAEIGRIAEEAAARWPLQALAVIHRTGRIEPGENIVLAITVSSHRGAAFAAAEYVMDFLKTEAPIWKKEHTVDGSATQWVEAKESDDDAVARWHESTEVTSDDQ
jgi:molybdopterin synthase catalytic subunit